MFGELSSPSTDRVTTDTIMWLRLSSASVGRGGGRIARARVGESLRHPLPRFDDTLRALHRLATACDLPGKKMPASRAAWAKTTTKEILAALLGAKLRILNRRQFQHRVRLPLTLFHLEQNTMRRCWRWHVPAI